MKVYRVATMFEDTGIALHLPAYYLFSGDAIKLDPRLDGFTPAIGIPFPAQDERMSYVLDEVIVK